MGGSEWKRLSKSTCAAPRRKMDAPMVMMMRLTVDAPSRRLDRKRPERQPDEDGRRHREHRRRRQGEACGAQEHAAHAAEHDELALGEVDHARRVVDQREAERDERIDRADGEP